MSYCRVIGPPPVEPLSLVEVKAECGIDHETDNYLLSSLISSAREYAENYCQLSLVRQTRELILDRFHRNIELPYGPVLELLEVDYIAVNGAHESVQMANINVYRNIPPILSPQYGKYWPVTRCQAGAVTIHYVAGFEPIQGDPTDYTSYIPSLIKTAMKALVASWYESSKSTSPANLVLVPREVNEMLGHYRVSWI